MDQTLRQSLEEARERQMTAIQRRNDAERHQNQTTVTGVRIRQTA
jgi:hypothetical protein